MENFLRPQLTVAMTSLLETEDKMAKVNTAKRIFEKKITQATSEFEKLQEQEISLRLKQDKQSQIRASRSQIDTLKTQKEGIVQKQLALMENHRQLE